MHFGIDISSNNVHPMLYPVVIDYLKQLGGGLQPFVFVKINQGTGYINPDAASDITGCRAAGALVAGYLMDQGNDPVASEETVFKGVAAALPQADDIELPSGLTTAEYIAHTQQLIAQNPKALQYLNQAEVAEGFPSSGGLWLAEYNNTPGITTYGCLVHQYTDSGTIPGVPGVFDLNVWCGSNESFAAFFNLPTNAPLTKPVVGMAPTPSGNGYWEVATDGGIFAYGDAHFHGSLGGTVLAAPIVGIAATITGGGYWLAAADGGVFCFGDAVFYGSAGGEPLAKPVVGISRTPDGKGYWLVAADGGIFTYGDATFEGAA